VGINQTRAGDSCPERSYAEQDCTDNKFLSYRSGKQVSWACRTAREKFMAQHIKCGFAGASMKLDDNDFVECTFRDCALVYAGGRPPTLDNCSFSNVRFKFEGPAENTVAFLKAMASPKSGLQIVVRETFPGLCGN
jgi:hypothetical protein